MPRRIFRIVSFLSFYSLLLFISGCIDLQKEYPAAESYLIDVARESPPPSSRGDRVLRIRNIRVSPRFQDQRFVYRKGVNRYEADYYNRFFIPPEDMLAEEVRDWLEKAKIFARVTDRPTQVNPDYFLEGSVTALLGDYSVKPPEAVIGMEFSLFRDLPAGAETQLKQSYVQRMPVPDTSPEALVEGWEKGLRRILNDLESDLRRARSENTE